MTTEELMQPRWKVIADYPNNGYEVGYIINIYHEKNSVTDQQKAFYNKYPHLFKPLQWWEEREASEMPEYVKSKDYPDSILKKVDYWYSNEDHYGFLVGKSFFLTSQYLPATLDEYNSYINQKPKTNG